MKDKNEKSMEDRHLEFLLDHDIIVDYTKKKTKKTAIFSWFVLIAIALLVAFCIHHFILLNVSVASNSMEDTLKINERIIGTRLHTSYKRGDVIIFRHPDNENEWHIKRILALPQDEIAISAGVVKINGEIVTESYTKNNNFVDMNQLSVPKGCYVVMGDNRADSLDSKDWSDPFLKKEKILGKAVFTYYPSLKIIK